MLIERPLRGVDAGPGGEFNRVTPGDFESYCFKKENNYWQISGVLV